MRRLNTVILVLIASILRSGSSASADTGAANAACQARISAGLLQGAAIGVISNGSQSETFCGDISNEHQAFQLGSISKSFAGAIASLLSSRGDLDLDAPIANYIPELQNTYMGTATARQLATHTARLVRSYSNPQNQISMLYSEPELITFLKAYQPDPKLFPPGKRSYSNVGFGTLGMVISRIEGKSYTQAIQDEILSPLGLKETGFILSATRPASIVQGYDILMQPLNYINVSDLAAAAGGVYSDLHDMMIYLGACLNPDDSDMGHAMRDSQTQGLGWDSLPGELPTWKNGLMTDGYSTMIKFDPTKKLGTIVLGNEVNAPSISALASIALGSQDTSHIVPLDHGFITTVSGTYVSSDGKEKIVVSATADQNAIALQMTQISDSNVARLLSIAGEDNRFWVDTGLDNSDQILFEIDPATMQMKALYFSVDGTDVNNNPVYRVQSLSRASK